MLNWLEPAIEYAERDWHVFPLRPDKKTPATRHGFKDATLTKRRLESWAREFPDANIGIATGQSDLIVVDVDPKNGGHEGFRNLVDRVGLEAFEGALRVRTPSGGFHLYYRAPKGAELGSPIGLAPGVDIRGRGAYVVAPPSTLANRNWSWEVDGNEGPATMPSALVRLLREVKASNRRADAHDAGTAILDNRPIPKGERNRTMISLAGQLRKIGLSTAEIGAALTVANKDRCKPPLEGYELDSILVQAANWSPGFDKSLYIRGWLPRVKGNALKLLIFLCENANGDGTLTPALALIERETEMSQQRISEAAQVLETIHRAIQREIKATQVLGREATRYRLLPPMPVR